VSIAGSPPAALARPHPRKEPPCASVTSSQPRHSPSRRPPARPRSSTTRRCRTRSHRGIEEQTGFAAEVTCPEEERPLEAGDVFDCNAAFEDGTEQVVTVTQQDAEGNIEWELK